MLTHHSVMTSSLRFKILKIDKFGDFSCDFGYNSMTEVHWNFLISNSLISNIALLAANLQVPVVNFVLIMFPY